jgi:hypothetical protein
MVLNALERPCGMQKLDPAEKRAHSATSLASDDLRMEGVRLGEK